MRLLFRHSSPFASICINGKQVAATEHNMRHASAPAKLLDASFESCWVLQELFQPLSPDLVALQLSSGLLKGRVQVWGFDGFRLNLLTTNQALFLNGARRPEPCTPALPLDPSESDGAYQAQGISMPWPGLMGYNRSLIDFDLKLPA